MIFARYEGDCGEVFVSEGLNLEMAYRELQHMCTVDDYSAVTFWEAQKLKTRIDVTVKIVQLAD